MSVIVGMGEIGSAFYKILASAENVYGFDVIPDKCAGTKPTHVDLLHICFPFTNSKQFKETVNSLVYDGLAEIVIHSSVEPGTTETLQKQYPKIKFVYSPFRGVHARMQKDMKRYIKYYAIPSATPTLFLEQMRKAGIPTKRWNSPTRSLELAKLLMDVTYYGWLIIFAQHVKILAQHFQVNDQPLWEFTDEIHKFLGNRPRMQSGKGIGGHCVMQDKNLLNDSFLDAVFSHDEYYRRNLDGR